MVPLVAGMPRIEWQSGREWFEGLDPDSQVVMMGQRKWEAWRAGKFDLAKLVTVKHSDTWGDSVAPTPLRNLVPQDQAGE